MSESNNTIRSEQHFYSDLSFWSLLITNIITMIWALKEGWSLGIMIWVYLCQNVILGFFWPAKVLASAVDSSYAKKVQSLAVFLPHYLLMHFIYATCLYNSFGKELSANFKSILIMVGFFLVSEIVSCFKEDNSNRTKPLSLAKVQLFPYARILPMHFVLMGGSILEKTGTSSLRIVAIFLLLKALADVAMYMVERSSVLDSFVTGMFEMQRRRGFFDGYSNFGEKQEVRRKENQEVCRFCQRVIGKNETPWVIKENVVCEECYNRIEKEKEKTS